MTRQERMKYDERAREIVRKMTFEEKVHLMSGSLTPQKMLEDFSTPGYHYNMVPYPAGGNERQGVPSLRFCDGPRGVVCGNSTCFPVTMGRAPPLIPTWRKEWKGHRTRDKGPWRELLRRCLHQSAL